MSEPYVVPDSELRWWELRIRRWGEAHPDTYVRLDKFLNSDKAAPFIGAWFIWIIGAAPFLLVGAVCAVLAVLRPADVVVAPAVVGLLTGAILSLMFYSDYKRDLKQARKRALNSSSGVGGLG